MIIHQLQATDLYSFEYLNIVFSKSGLVSVLGENRDDNSKSNYSGKSNIFECLTWTLYGKGTKEIKPDGKSDKKFRVEQVIRNGAKSCVGIAYIESNGELYIIKRTRDFYGSSLVIIDIDGNEISGKSIAETQKIVDDLLGMSYNTFVSSVFFAQNSRSFSQASDAEIKTLLDEVIELEIWARALKEVKDLIKPLKDERTSIERKNEKIQAEISGLQTARDMALVTFQKAQDTYDNWQIEHDQKITKMKEDILHYNMKLTLLKSPTLDDLENHFEKLTKFHSEKTSRMDFLKNEISIKRSRLNEIEEQVSAGNCPTCEQSVSDAYLESIEDKYYTGHLEEEFEDLCAEIEGLETQIKTITKGIELHELKLYEEAQENPYENPNLIDVNAVSLKIRELEDSLENTDELDNNIRLLSILQEAFGNSGIKSLILDNILPMLNDKVSYYARMLIGDIDVRFDTERTLASGEKRDEFSIDISFGGVDGYSPCSNGLRKKVDFAIALALQSLMPQTNLFIFDEPFEGLDSVGQEQILQTLREISTERELGIYVITHNEAFQSYFDEEIVVIKENRVSKLTADSENRK